MTITNQSKLEQNCCLTFKPIRVMMGLSNLSSALQSGRFLLPLNQLNILQEASSLLLGFAALYNTPMAVKVMVNSTLTQNSKSSTLASFDSSQNLGAR